MKQWNPLLSGKLVVWEAEGGRRVVADGHQRLGLAKRIADEDPGADIWLDAITLREADGVTAQEARVWSALKNIAEGSGTTVDAAKVLREAGEAFELPSSAIVRDARAVARLHPEAFGAIVNEVIPADQGAVIGRVLPDDGEGQLAMVDLLAQVRPATAQQAETVVRQAVLDGFARAEARSQLSLFGENERIQSLFVQRAKTLDDALRSLRRDRTTFRTLIANAGRIEESGNVLARDTNVERVSDAERADQLIRTLANRFGPVRDALVEAVRLYPAAGRRAAAVKHFLDAVSGLELRDVVRAMGDGGGDGAVAAGAGRGGDAPGEAGGMDGGGAAGPDDAQLEFATATLPLGLDDPHGPAAAQLTDLIEHDVRPRTVPTATTADPPASVGGLMTMDAIITGQLGRSLDDLHASAVVNQAELATVLTDIVRMQGLEFVDPGVKRIERVREKIALEGYVDAGDIKDMARGAVIVDTPAQGDAIVAMLIERMAVADKGWKTLSATGYVDRKLVLRFANGGVAELQLVPRAVWNAKKAGLGDLYERSRILPSARAVEGSALEARQRAGYAEALAASGWPSASMSASGNSVSASARERLTPSSDALLTSPGASRQPDPAFQAQALDRDTVLATSRSSTSHSSSDAIGDPSGYQIMRSDLLDNGQPPTPDPAIAEADRQRVQLEAEAPMRPRVDQDGHRDLPMFESVEQPELFAMGETVAGGEAAPELRAAEDMLSVLDADDAAIAAVRECLL